MSRPARFSFALLAQGSYWLSLFAHLWVVPFFLFGFLASLNSLFQRLTYRILTCAKDLSDFTYTNSFTPLLKLYEVDYSHRINRKTGPQRH